MTEIAEALKTGAFKPFTSPPPPPFKFGSDVIYLCQKSCQLTRRKLENKVVLFTS